MPHVLRLRAARAGHGALPGGVLSDLCHGGRARRLPGRRRSRRPPGRRAASTSAPIDPDDAGARLVLWSNSPSNPTGGLGDLAPRRRGAGPTACPVFSDECYAEFTWDGPPRSVLAARLRRRGGGALAVQALEPGRRPGRLLRRGRRARRVPAGRPPARRADGARAGAGGRRGRPGRRRATSRRSGPATASAWSFSPASSAPTGPGRAARRWLLPLGAGARRPAGPTPGPWPRRWPATAGCW